MPSLVTVHEPVDPKESPPRKRSTKQQQQKRRLHYQQHYPVILLLDLDCFYAQCECIRLGFEASDTPLALLQWDSVLAVTYPARSMYHIKRGDSWQSVREKSKNGCHAIHVPVLVPTTSTNAKTTGTPPLTCTPHNRNLSLQEEYDSIFKCPNEAKRLEIRNRELGVRRFSSEGKASIERYRTASARIFETVQGWIVDKKLQDYIVLERASIDEFFLDATKACALFTSFGGDDNGTEDCNIWDKFQMDQAKRATVKVGSRELERGEQRKDWCQMRCEETRGTMHQTEEGGMCSEDDCTIESGGDDDEIKALDVGTFLARSIRETIRERLGFTLSAGIGCNKTIAKLAASYGKPNGQAVVYPHAVEWLMDQTPISKCRNLGGKLGMKVQALLSTLQGNQRNDNARTENPPTVGSIRKYLSLPDLQRGLRDFETATWVYNVARGIDREVVQAKSDSAASAFLTKTVTAFKSLPFQQTGYALDEAQKWFQLLADDIVIRIERDAQRHDRYPRTCAIHYNEANLRSNKRSKSIRIAFPPERLSTQEKMHYLATTAPKTIANKEGKDFRVNRVGFCAADFVSKRVLTNAHTIDSYFGSSKNDSVSRPTKNKKEAALLNNPYLHAEKNDVAITTEDVDVKEVIVLNSVNPNSPSAQIVQQATDGDSCSSTINPNICDTDLMLAKKLQDTYDSEHRVLKVLEEKGKSVAEGASSNHNDTIIPGYAKNKVLKGSNFTSSHAAMKHTDSTDTRCTTEQQSSVDSDVELARKLQARYDRENAVYSVLDRRDSTKRRPPKTRRIDTFFQK